MSSTLEQIGNYRLLKHLGSGGQASVYLGEHLFLKRRSAIKILHTSLDEQNSALFLREAQILASLNHPHIIRIHDFTIEQGEPLLAMDYAPGGTLRSCFPTDQPLPLEMLLTYLQQMASALQYAHDRGIIHRDIKPENLLLDEQQQIKLSDFGLALLAPSPEQLKTQELIGTVFYLERLQPSALSTPRQRNVYHTWAVRLPGMLMGGLIGAWVSSLFVMTFYTIDSGMTTYPFAAFGCLFGVFLGFLLTGRQKTPRRRAVRFSKSVAHSRTWMHTALMHLTHTHDRTIPQRQTPRRSPVAWTEHVRNGFILGICAWLVQELLSVLEVLWSGMALTPQMLLGISLVDLWLTLLPYALVGFLASLLIKRTRSDVECVREEGRLLSYLWRSLTESSSVRNVLIGSLLGLIVDIGSLLFVILRGYPSWQEFSFVFTDILNLSASFGIISLLASLFIRRAGTQEIEPTEKITWSWESLLGSFLKLKHLGYALLIGLCYTLLYGMLSLVLGVQSLGFWFASVFSVFGIVALVGWLLITLFGGWSGEMLDERKLVTPNQGMRRSAFSALLFGLLSWLVYGGISWLVGELASWTPFVKFIAQDWFKDWFLYGLPCALTIGLLIGG